MGRRVLIALAVLASIAPAGCDLGRPSVVVPTGTSPAPTAATASSPSPTPSPLFSPRPIPSPTPGAAPRFGPPVSAGEVTVRSAQTSVPPDHRYVTTFDAGAKRHWTVLVDPAGRATRVVSQVDIVIPPGSQSTPSISVSASADGRMVLLSAFETGSRVHHFLLDISTGDTRLLGSVERSGPGSISPDGSLFAYDESGEDASRRGLWIGKTGDRSVRRAIVGAFVTPIAFSPDGSRLAGRVHFGRAESGIAIVPTAGSDEARLDASARTISGGTLLLPGSGFDWGGAPGDVWVWESRIDTGPSAGGVNAVHSFDLATGRSTLVYRPAAPAFLEDVWRSPKLDRFLVVEVENAQARGARAMWLRTRQGGVTKVADLFGDQLHSPWWSADGSRLYALRGGFEEAVGAVVELLTADVVVSYCRRSAAPPCP